MLRRPLLIIDIPVDQELQVVPALSKVLRPVTVINLMPEVLRVLLCVYCLFRLYFYFLSEPMQFFLDCFILFAFLLSLLAFLRLLITGKVVDFLVT